jgi:hypothetical protein
LIEHKCHEKTNHDHIDQSLAIPGDSSSGGEVKIPEMCLQRRSPLGTER